MLLSKFLFYITAMKFLWCKIFKNLLYEMCFKNAYKEPRALLTDLALCAMFMHFHNGITFPIKLSELHHVLFEVFALVVPWVNSMAFKILLVLCGRGCFAVSCSSALNKKHDFFFRGNVMIEAYLNRLHILIDCSEWRQCFQTGDVKRGSKNDMFMV